MSCQSRLQPAWAWVQAVVDWYNNEHLHGSINFVTLKQRHTGKDVDILPKHQQVYLNGKSKNPGRWSDEIRYWEPIKEVHVNPETKKVEIEENKAA